jgi:hypothetical protein
LEVKRGTIKKGEEKLERKKIWKYEKRFMSNDNERYPMVASGFFRHLLLDTKVKVQELRVGSKERHNQERTREVREEEDMEI